MRFGDYVGQNLYAVTFISLLPVFCVFWIFHGRAMNKVPKSLRSRLKKSLNCLWLLMDGFR